MTTGCHDTGFDIDSHTWNLLPIFFSCLVFFSAYTRRSSIRSFPKTGSYDGQMAAFLAAGRQYGGGGFIGRAPFQEMDTSIDGCDACLGVS